METAGNELEKMNQTERRERVATALEASTWTPLHEDNVANNPDVFCIETVSSTTVTEIDLGISFNVQEHRRMAGQASVTSVQRQRRVEVFEREMSVAERVLMLKAKAREWNALLDNDAVEACHREGIPLGRIMRCRWGFHSDTGRNAIGYLDPDSTKFDRDAQTMSAVVEQLLVQLCASEH